MMQHTASITKEICLVLSCNNRKMSQGVLIHQTMEQLVQRKETQHVLMKVTVRMTEEEESGGESVMQFYAIVEGPCNHKTD